MRIDSADDATLIELITNAHTSALEELYNRYSRLVFSVALTIMSDRSAAEEVTLDVFVQVWQKAGTYRAERANVRTWLLAIARHHAIDILRWQRSRPDTRSLELNSASLPNGLAVTGLEDGVDLNLERERVRGAMSRLPEDQREALTLAYFGGYTHTEIAGMLEQPLGTVKTRIRSAMHKLREFLDDEDEPPAKSDHAGPA